PRVLSRRGQRASDMTSQASISPCKLKGYVSIAADGRCRPQRTVTRELTTVARRRHLVRTSLPLPGIEHRREVTVSAPSSFSETAAAGDDAAIEEWARGALSRIGAEADPSVVAAIAAAARQQPDKRGDKISTTRLFLGALEAGARGRDPSLAAL